MWIETSSLENFLYKMSTYLLIEEKEWRIFSTDHWLLQKAEQSFE